MGLGRDVKNTLSERRRYSAHLGRGRRHCAQRARRVSAVRRQGAHCGKHLEYKNGNG